MKNFKMTDLQQAYWFGEQDIFRLNTPACLCRSYFSEQLDIERLKQVLAAMTQAHPMVHARFQADGRQQVWAQPDDIPLHFTDMREAMPAEDVPAFQKESLLKNMPALEQGANIVCAVARVDKGFHIHFLFRLIAFDGLSVRIFLKELTERYAGGYEDSSPLLPMFEQHVEKRQSLKESQEYQHSLGYWHDRIEGMARAPELPLVNYEQLPKKSAFTRRKAVLDKEQTARLALHARKCGVSLTILLCTAYSDILRMWSKNESFTLNMLMSNRSPEFAQVLGNFSDTLLLEVTETSGSFGKRAVALRQQLGRDMEHAQVSGIEVIRAMRSGADGLPTMPVVFASLLGMEGKGPSCSPLDLGWQAGEGFLHTPQVLLDHQVSMENEQLVLNWDSVDSAFMPGVAEEMFTAYQEHLNGIIESEQPRDQLLLPAVPTRFMERRVAANNTARELPKGTLFDFIRDACDRFPENKAVVTPERVISYRELWGMSSRLAAKLRNCGVGRNDLVAICASKGWQQVVAAISVIQAGAAYLPVSVELPRARKSYLLAQERVKVVLAEHAQLNDLLVPVGVQALVLEDCFASQDGMQAQLLDPGLQQDDLAYVIFTSGSTGTPKGVAIDHRGVVNTLQDVIRRFGLTSSDRVIGISAFNFDLSVYDIFATLGSGAALVLPKYNQTPDPDEWARCVKQHGVTVWNTVPALLEMMVEFLGTQAKAFLSSLRLIMLSGDWIPLSLPGRIKEIAPGSAIVSLGGATEASIWSNYFIVDHVDPSWKSVPYGWPLSNQVFHVLDKNMQPVPNWVSGELYIGGIGLAKEYYQDPERTAASFVTHPQSGERLYRTGDLGRYHDSGYIEFLGRNDGQIKIRGYRIELGEIESALEQCHGVRGGAVVVRTVVKGDKQLVAFAVLYKEQDDGSIESVREHLARQLPDYMVPQHIVVLEQMPVTANGKVDRKRLLEMAGNLSDKGEEKELPRNETEKRLSAIWCRLLKLDSVGVEDNFFELGGSSLTAVRLLRMIEDEFDKKIELASLFRFGSIALQAQHLQDAVVSHSSRPLNTGSSLVKIREGAGNSILAVVHPVGGNILCYRSLIELVPREVAVVGLQSPGDGKPRTVNELATAYAEAIAPMLTRAGMKVDILGWSMGGVVGHEMTRLLEVKGFKIGSLTMIDSWMGTKTATPADTLDGFPLLRNFVKDFLMGKGLPSGFDEIVNRAPEEWISAALKELEHASSVAGYLSAAEFSRLLGEYQCNFNALIRHRPGLVRARVNQFRASRAKDFPFLEPFSQGGQHDGAVDFTSVTVMNEDHFSIMQAQALQYIVGSIFQPQKHLRELESV